MIKHSKNEKIKLGLNDANEKLGSLVNLGVSAIIFPLSIRTSIYIFSIPRCCGTAMKCITGINSGSKAHRNDDRNL